MKPPCDQGVIVSGHECPPVQKSAGPWILAVTILGSSMAFIDSTVVNVSLPAIQADLGGTLVGIQWVVEGYSLFLSALILVGGSMGDIFGRRRMFLFGVTVFVVASAACGFCRTIQELVAARMVQGLGAAFLVPGSLAIISASFDENGRGRAIGTWSGFTGITSAVGPVLGGWLTEHASWRWVFFINVPIAAAVIVLSMWRVQESKSAEARSIDWIGVFLTVVALAGLTYGLIEAGRLPWSDPAVWGSVGAGCLSVILFVYFEYRQNSPMVPMSLFHSRDFSGANLLTFFLYSGLGVFFFLFPLNLIQIQHYSATAAGAAALPLILLMFFLSRWSGGLVMRYGPHRPLMIGPAIAGLGFIFLAIPSVGGNYWMTFFPGFIVLGLGMAVSVAPLTTVVMEAVSQDEAGTASGINNAVARVAGLLAVALLGIVLTNGFKHDLDNRIAKLSLPAEALENLWSNEVRLGDMPVPSDIDSRMAALVRESIDRAFVFGFRVIMLICAGLAFLSSAVAWGMIGLHPQVSKKLQQLPSPT